MTMLPPCSGARRPRCGSRRRTPKWSRRSPARTDSTPSWVARSNRARRPTRPWCSSMRPTGISSVVSRVRSAMCALSRYTRSSRSPRLACSGARSPRRPAVRPVPRARKASKWATVGCCRYVRWSVASALSATCRQPAGMPSRTPPLLRRHLLAGPHPIRSTCGEIRQASKSTSPGSKPRWSEWHPPPRRPRASPRASRSEWQARPRISS